MHAGNAFPAGAAPGRPSRSLPRCRRGSRQCCPARLLELRGRQPAACRGPCESKQFFLRLDRRIAQQGRSRGSLGDRRAECWRRTSHEGPPDPPALGQASGEAVNTAAQLPARESCRVQPGRATRRDGGALPAGSNDALEMDRRLRRLATILPPSPDDPFRWIRQRAIRNSCFGTLNEPWTISGVRRVLNASRCLPLPRSRTCRRPPARSAGSGGRAATRTARGLLNSRRQAARAGLVVTATDVLLLDDKADVTAQIGVLARLQAETCLPGWRPSFLPTTRARCRPRFTLSKSLPRGPRIVRR